jgi:2-polyprenyl-6-methoxyphenol hydroxylase-like FAD-dependent oxidoreductase
VRFCSRARERIFLDQDGQIIERHETPQMQISWDILFRSFRERLPDRNYLQGQEVVSASEHGGAAYLTFSDGITVEADLVIGVDGVGSIVRRAVAGDAAAPVYAGGVARSLPGGRLAEFSGRNAARAPCILRYASVPLLKSLRQSAVQQRRHRYAVPCGAGE